MERYYAARAAEYEQIYSKPERQDDLRALRLIVRQLLAETHLFEVACGTGYWTEIVADSAASVVATDFNEEVLAIARTKPIDSERVGFLRADAYALPLLPRRFTAGFAAFWWSHVPRSRLHQFLQGFHAVLAPGARVVFIDNLYVEGSSTPVSRTDEECNTYQLRRLSNGTTHEVLKNFPSESELCEAVAGLAEEVEVRLLPYYWVLSYAIRSGAVL